MLDSREIARRIRHMRDQEKAVLLRVTVCGILVTIANEIRFGSGAVATARDLEEYVEIGPRLRRPYLRPAEREVLVRLFDSDGPLNKWELSHPKGIERKMLWYTQVRRAVAGLVRKKAIEAVPGSERRWRSGRVVVTYRPTPLGSLLYLRDKQQSLFDSTPLRRLLLECLQDVATHTNSKHLRDLVVSIKNIPNRQVRATHLFALANIVLERCDKLGIPDYDRQMAFRFAYQTWSSWKDISAYRVYMPAEYRESLSETRRQLLAWERRIGGMLRPTPRADWYRSRGSTQQDLRSLKKRVQTEVRRQAKVKMQWIERRRARTSRSTQGYAVTLPKESH